MDENDGPEQPDKPSPPILFPTSREDPPLLEELAENASASSPPDSNQPPGEHPPIDWLAPFENRLIIAGMSLLGVLALTAIVLLVFSRGDGDLGFTPRVSIIDDENKPTPTSEFVLTAEALATTTLHNGPSTGFVPLGTVPRGARVPVVGRNEDDTWLQITYPPGSPLRGWVDITFFEVTGDLHVVEIAGPGAGPSIEVPTSLPTVVVEEPTDTPEPFDDPTDTPESEETPLVTETRAPAETPEPMPTGVGPDPTVTSVLKPESSPTEPTPSP